jgi:hypothetical protein
VPWMAREQEAVHRGVQRWMDRAQSNTARFNQLLATPFASHRCDASGHVYNGCQLLHC